MKREISFRIKVILTNEGKLFYNNQSEFIESKIHNVISLDLIHNQCVVYDENKESVITIFEHYCETYELMQFTGLLDKNGVKIFEGDILDNNEIVTYSNGCFMTSIGALALSANHREIIGNIHDGNDKN